MMSDITTKENRGKGMVGTYAYHINAYNAYIFLLVFINWLGFWVMLISNPPYGDQKLQLLVEYMEDLSLCTKI